MGMAASQARYLALVARKSNCEYEGQQINQSRLNLANQTANLFNQMLGLSVPVPPSTQDFTKLQYSFTDGINGSVIDKWEQLARPDDKGNNYVVEYHYEANVYKGFQKKMNDPQVQFSYSVPTEQTNITLQKQRVAEIKTAQDAVSLAQTEYDVANNNYQAMLSKGKSLVTYRDRSVYTGKKAGYDSTEKMYYLQPTAGGEKDVYLASFKDMTGVETYAEALAKKEAGTLVGEGLAAFNAVQAWKGDGIDIDVSKMYFTVNPANVEEKYKQTSTGKELTKTGTGAQEDPFVFKDDTDQVVDEADVTIIPAKVKGALTDEPSIALISDIENMTGLNGDSTTLPVYKFGTTEDEETEPYSIYGMQTALNTLKDTAETKLNLLENAKSDLAAINMPTYAGNSKLTSLGELTQEQLAEIKQIIRTMTENGVQSNFDNCFESSLNLTEDNYTGGIYSFERDGVTYYTTYFDLADAAIDSEFTNDIDNQPKMNYYHANYVKENVYTTDKAVLDTDSKGRFKTVRFDSDGAEYTLTVEQITDDVAYQDAMNKYAYESAEYDKMIQDINAKTSLIHQQDQQLELKLKQLDTEQNALSNEIDAVSKVVKDNVEKSFKTFGG